jgi:hypothetical protein
MGVCVVFQGLTVGWVKEERHSSDTTARSAGFKSQAGWAPPMDVCAAVFHVVLSRKRGWVGVGGRESTAHKRKKKERKKQADRKVDQYGEKGKANKKTKKSTHNIKTVRNVCLQLPNIMLLSSLFVLNV